MLYMIEVSQYESLKYIQSEINYVSAMVDKYNYDQNSVRMTVVVYNDQVSKKISFSHNKDKIKQRLVEMSGELQPSGEPSLAKALDYVRTHPFQHVSKGRGAVPRLLIPLVHSVNDTELDEISQAGQRLKEDCIHATVLSVGTNGRHLDEHAK